MCSRPYQQCRGRRYARRVWLAGMLSLGLAAHAIADERPATMLMPQPATISANNLRASGDPLVPGDVPSPTEQQRTRDSNFVYPSTFKDAKRESEPTSASGFWNRIIYGKPFASDDKQPVETDAIQAASHKRIQGQPIVQQAPPAVNAPAWRWYGYGAPTPGRNIYAPDGVYGKVDPSYHDQNGSTPGAVPLAQPNVLPKPSIAEPPTMSSQPSLEPPVTPLPDPALKNDLVLPPVYLPEMRPANLEPPVRPTMIPPLSAAPTFSPSFGSAGEGRVGAVTRAQAPAADVPAALLTALRSACTGYVTKIDLTPKGPNKIALRLTLVEGVFADRIANRIAKLPDLANYEIEMEFPR